MTDYWYDSSTGSMVLNDTDVDTNVVLQTAGNHPELAAMLAWVTSTTSRKGGLFERDKYTTPKLLFKQFDTAEDAAESDDVVSGVLDTTESLAFSKTGFEAVDPDEQDVWNQIAKGINLDARLREMWRDLFIFSQVYCAAYWGRKTFKVRGKTIKGNSKRRVFGDLYVPLGVTILDPRKVIPAGNLMFNKERLVYLADSDETETFDRVLRDGKDSEDKIVKQLIVARYEIDKTTRKYLEETGHSSNNRGATFLLNPSNVWRHTLTRPQYRPFASVRLKAIFELLDLKHQLKEMDRAHIVGSTHFIVLITKGTDEHPATPNEIRSLSGQVRVASRVPVLVGDHRLDVKIITPSLDNTLDKEKYDLIDTRITTRLFKMFVNASGRQEDSLKLARVVARGMESWRHMLRRSLEANLISPTVETNDSLSAEPKLVFRPKRIALDFDMSLATFLSDIRDRGELSRDTLLSEFDFDQDEEARKRQLEREMYDDIFRTAVPFSSPSSNPADGNQNKPEIVDSKVAGRTGGGRRGGGGAAPGTPQGKSKEQQQ